MPAFGFGLRAKSLLALLLACLFALLPTGFIGWQVLQGVQSHFGLAYAKNLTQLNRQNILAPVSRDLALARLLARSLLARQWLLEEDNTAKRELFFREAEHYRQGFSDQNYFLISALSRNYFLNAKDKPHSQQPRYRLDPEKTEDAWFFNSLEHTQDYNINVNTDVHMGITQVWLNVIVREGERKIGLAGTGLNLTGFLKEFIATGEPGVTPIILDSQGAIQAHPDTRLIAFNSGSGTRNQAKTLASLLDSAQQRRALEQTMAAAQAKPALAHSLWVNLQGKRQLLALAYIPELRWHLVTAVDLNEAQIMEPGWALAVTGVLALLLLVLLLAFGAAVERVVLKPLRTLHQSATALAEGNYQVSLPPPGRDELGDLNRAFGTMASQIKANTKQLEDKVRERTQKLEQANRDMASAHQKINDSIDYASLIQRAMLPSGQLSDMLGAHHFVLWHPRDVVGGDFYLFRAQDDERYLIGVVDCAGHGVPGALMTMLARAAFDDAMNRQGLDSPAALLGHADASLREMIQQSELPRAIATNMDAGLAYIDRKAGQLRYAGAKIALYWSDGAEVGEIKGGRRPLCDRKLGVYSDQTLEMRPGTTYYLVTDGYLDQAGGELGYGFGNSRFAALLQEHARLPMQEQAAALNQALEAYRGDHQQRDDITLLSFRIG
ncbi:MAG: biofilm regulation protein phosphatase SiaA [Gammaproteobacteria bacterium SHHR-1]|uniref:biofilm regulation protein phosphatase SiaA n=1 Tax=Magnetovirga frankeli TaxID=947516 RepID=UPI001294107A|nr:SpoIIE family protein phosphatase [gamma proteobacterium SS-5]